MVTSCKWQRLKVLTPDGEASKVIYFICLLYTSRVHNHVAHPDFYRLCAEAGLAVWQDFPLDKKYERNITGVALRQIRAMVGTLRNCLLYTSRCV